VGVRDGAPGNRQHPQEGQEWFVLVPAASPSSSSPSFALVEEGDEVIYPNPGFPLYESMSTVSRRENRADFPVCGGEEDSGSIVGHSKNLSNTSRNKAGSFL